jgi:uncharacterized protein YbaR (Trm112 family)
VKSARRLRWRSARVFAIEGAAEAKAEATRMSGTDPHGVSADEGGGARAPGRADPKLLEILVCPLTRATLAYDAEKQELISRAAKLAYPIRDGVPIMLPEEARRLEE